MSDRSRLDDQIRNYRELAKMAVDCSRRSRRHRDDYLELASRWNALADSLADRQNRTSQDIAKPGLQPATYSPRG